MRTWEIEVRNYDRDNHTYRRSMHYKQRVYNDVHLQKSKESDFTGSWGEEENGNGEENGEENGED